MSAHIQVLGWNHRKEIGPCLASCLRQTVKMPVIFIDNNSNDGSVEYVREKFPEVKILENKTNRGYAGGHNDGLRAMPDTDIAILLNPDVILEEKFTEEIVKMFTEKIGAVAPVLLREKRRTKNGAMETIVDSYGTSLLPSGRAVNNFEGQVCQNDFFDTPIWGFTGAAVAISRKAINDVSINGEFFDELLHSYREDVDVSWRMRNRGWQVAGAPTARAWHARAARVGEKKSSRVRGISWRNYFLVLIKNAPPGFLKENIFSVSWEIVLRIGQYAVTPALWREGATLLKLIPVFAEKRKSIGF